MGAGHLVLLGTTVARGLLASAFALFNERLCSSRASTSGSSRCRTDDLLHAPRGPARRGIETRPRGPLRLLARGVDAALGAACPVRSLVWAGGTVLTFPLLPPPQK